MHDEGCIVLCKMQSKVDVTLSLSSAHLRQVEQDGVHEKRLPARPVDACMHVCCVKERGCANKQLQLTGDEKQEPTSR